MRGLGARGDPTKGAASDPAGWWGVVSDPRVEIVCEVHHGAGHLVVRREGERIVLDAHADDCCVLVLDSAAVTVSCDVLGQCLG